MAALRRPGTRITLDEATSASGARFWVPEATETAGRYRLNASDAACVGIPGRRAPMGGVTTAATVEALEHATGRSLLWATAQFIAPAPVETDFEIRVEVVGDGRRVQRARATLANGSEPILVTAAALGDFEERSGETFQTPPDVAAAEACPPIPVPEAAASGVIGQFERRLALRGHARGLEAVWFRPLAGPPLNAGLLAILGDFLAGAHPDTRGSVGFDNTLRMVARPDTEWILAESRIAHIGEQTFHGAMHFYGEDRTLIAISSLTALRPRART